MAESMQCPACSSPVVIGQAFCANCGASLAGVAAPAVAPGESSDTATGVQGSRGGARVGKSKAAAREQTDAPTTPAEDLPAASESPNLAAPAAPVAPAQMEPTIGTDADPRLAALGLSPAAAPRPAAPQAGWPPAPQAAAPVSPAMQRRSLEPEGPAGPPERIPGAYVPPATGAPPSPHTLQPSGAGSGVRPSGPSLSVSVGAVPISGSSPWEAAPVAPRAPTAAPVLPPVLRTPAASPVPATPAQAAPNAQNPVALPPRPPEPVRPTLPPAPASAPSWPPAPTWPPVPAPVAPTPAPAWTPPPVAPPLQIDRPAAAPAAAPIAFPQGTTSATEHKDSVPELVSFGMVVGGAAVGIASLFLPWANAVGLGIGNYEASGQTATPNAWGWDMAAALPLLLISVLVLGAVAGSDVSQARLPKLAPIIRLVTDFVLPMLLGGLYLGVFILYGTLPNGFGIGLIGVLLGACSLIGGCSITLFYPMAVAGSAGSGDTRS